jgi:hypothetical protein
MVQFTEDGSEEPALDPPDLVALYQSLDRKASHVTPRDAQKEALLTLSGRLASRDLVLKMSTGYGKTTVALVYLHSHMLGSGRPVVYLCPTTQLVNQVLTEAANLGIKASYYRAMQPHPDPQATAGRSIIVCTYDKLFNGKSTFQREDVDLVPEAIALDDAHSGMDVVRDAFRIRIKLQDHDVLFAALLRLLRAPCRDDQPGQWAGIERADEAALIEVPFWTWTPLVEQLRPILEQRYQEEEAREHDNNALLFPWPYLRDHLRWCRCLVSGSCIEIVPELPPVQLARPFFAAKHRLFLSATLSDDSALVRELGCDPAAAKAPIIPPSDAGVGERMVLAPTLIDPALDRAWVMKWCQDLSRLYRVVVLTASEKVSSLWTGVGASVVMRHDVAEAVAALKAGGMTFVAFAQRYDGVDLPDDACRVLVLDGMPLGQSLADTHDKHIAGRTGGAHRRWIQRIEQGMGRAVRSQADYALIVLTGSDLVHFLAKKEVVEQMASATRAQLKAGEKLAQMAQSDARPAATVVHETAVQLLTRDPRWRAFYERNVRKNIERMSYPPDERQIAIAESEHLAQRAALANDAQKAARVIGDLINAVQPEPAQVGWLLQRKALFTFVFDPAEALKIQAAAFEKNQAMLTPPSGVTVRKARPGISAGAIALAWYNTFDHPNGAIAALAELKTRLSFDVEYHVLEQALQDVAQIFGATGSRPEAKYRRGPDDLWDWPTVSWVIEAKNERRGKLPKADSGQLHVSLKWFGDFFPEKTPVPVVVAREALAEDDASFPAGTRVLIPTGLASLVEQVTRFAVGLTKKEPSLWTPEAVGELLVAYKLGAAQFASAYTVPLTT